MKIRKMGRFLLWILPRDISAITIYPFGMYYRHATPSWLINHEIIHWCQQKEMLCLLFYLWYALEWMIKIIFNGRDAYYLISFEREAYGNEEDSYYVSTRKYYSWLKYIL